MYKSAGAHTRTQAAHARTHAMCRKLQTSHACRHKSAPKQSKWCTWKWTRALVTQAFPLISRYVQFTSAHAWHAARTCTCRLSLSLMMSIPISETPPMCVRRSWHHTQQRRSIPGAWGNFAAGIGACMCDVRKPQQKYSSLCNLSYRAFILASAWDTEAAHYKEGLLQETHAQNAAATSTVK